MKDLKDILLLCAFIAGGLLGWKYCGDNEMVHVRRYPAAAPAPASVATDKAAAVDELCKGKRCKRPEKCVDGVCTRKADLDGGTGPTSEFYMIWDDGEYLPWERPDDTIQLP